MIRNRIFWGIFLICQILISGCVDEIQFDVAENPDRNIVIQGMVKAGNPSLIEVRITYAVAFEDFFNVEPVRNAEVRLINESGTDLLIPEVIPGLYQKFLTNNPGFPIKEGENYRLMIVSDSATYESSVESLFPVPSPEKVTVKVTEKSSLNSSGNIETKPYLQFLLSTSLITSPGEEKSKLKWDFEGHYQFYELPPPFIGPSAKICYIRESVNTDQIAVLNGNEILGEQVTDHLILEKEIDYRFSDGYYLAVYQQSLSEGAWKYWSQAGQVIGRTGNLFEVPPGKIRSNIRNIENEEEEILGYFYLTRADTFYVKVTPDEVGLPSRFCSRFENYGSAADVCRNCLVRSGSSLQKPDFWVD